MRPACRQALPGPACRDPRTWQRAAGQLLLDHVDDDEHRPEVLELASLYLSWARSTALSLHRAA